MNRHKARRVLDQAFSVFTEEEKENVRWHLENGTEVLPHGSIFVARGRM